jgi:hypothetical protein
MMAGVLLTRNPLFGTESNTLAPQANQFEFYETTYTTGTTQEWILVPDRNGVSVTLTPSNSTASIEATDSPPDVVKTGSPAAITWPVGVISAATTAFLQGFTAFRVNLATGASVKLSAAV